jgi:homoserine kinase
MTFTVRAPATTANVGPGFDHVAIALDLWNEVELSDASRGQAPDLSHLGVRAFALLAPPDGLAFRWNDRIPRARGLGSSAATIALGLVAACRHLGRPAEAEELLALGLPLEGHADNLAACLAGGACLTWDGRIERLGRRVPAEPVAVIPEHEVETAAARASLPVTVPHADAAFTAGRAAILGGALASGSVELFAAALADRIHEPYRAAGAPLLDELRRALPRNALGVTLSGSGPTVIVWTREGDAGACVDELAPRFPNARVVRLAVTEAGAAT